jgi:hypothetical protein
VSEERIMKELPWVGAVLVDLGNGWLEVRQITVLNEKPDLMTLLARHEKRLKKQESSQ